MAASSSDRFLRKYMEVYYKKLHEDPYDHCRYYREPSILTRPDSNGVMTTVHGIQGIRNLIHSLDFKHCSTEIKSTVAQDVALDCSRDLVLVTGIFTDKDGRRRLFSHILILQPGEKRIAVLNDLFWFHEECGPDERSEVEGYPIDVSIFPPRVTVDQLETEFKKFGSVKKIETFPDNMREAFCRAMIRFQDSTSVDRALQALPITMGGMEAPVESARVNSQSAPSASGGELPQGGRRGARRKARWRRRRRGTGRGRGSGRRV